MKSPLTKLKLAMVGSETAVVTKQLERAARKHGWSQRRIDKLVAAALAGDYDAVFKAIEKHCDDRKREAD